MQITDNIQLLKQLKFVEIVEIEREVVYFISNFSLVLKVDSEVYRQNMDNVEKTRNLPLTDSSCFAITRFQKERIGASAKFPS